MIDELRLALSAALSPKLPAAPYALLDFPNHPNVGDSAIWLGELKILEALTGRKPAYVCQWNNCDWAWLETFDGTIILHGGGNFGDIYGWYQDFREEVLRRFPGRLVIQLPQTIHFKDPARLARTQAAIKAHGALLLYVRDRESLKIAEAFDCETILAPDSAFFLDLATIGRPRHEVVFLHRTDDEASAGGDRLPVSWVEVDWLDEPKGVPDQVRRRVMAGAFLRGQTDRRALRERLYRVIAETRLKRGIRLLSSGRTIVTDRLHAHILSILLGVPHWVIDNNYGKLTSFIAAWGTDRAGTGRVAADLASLVKTGV